MLNLEIYGIKIIVRRSISQPAIYIEASLQLPYQSFWILIVDHLEVIYGQPDAARLVIYSGYCDTEGESCSNPTLI